MTIRAFTPFVAECDCMDDAWCEEHHRRPCRAAPESDGSAIWYASYQSAKDDLDAWGWYVDGERVYCAECKRYCDECSTYRGHRADCDSEEAERWWGVLEEEVFRG